MPLIDAKLVSKEMVGGMVGDRSTCSWRTIFVFMVPNIEALDSVGGPLDSSGVLDYDLIRFRIGPKALLESLKIKCASEDFDITIRDRNIEDALTIYDCLAVTGLDRYYYNAAVNVPLVNKDDLYNPDSYVYMEFVNQDSNDTGNIIIELGVTQI